MCIHFSESMMLFHTYLSRGDFVEVMEMLDKRLNDKGKNWRHVFKVWALLIFIIHTAYSDIPTKSLTVLDYCLHGGSENVVLYFRDNLYVIKTLKEFQYIDELGKDQGANVRQKAKDISNLLQDEARLREERRSRAHMRDRMVRGGATEDITQIPDEVDTSRRRRKNQPNGSARNDGDDELKRAIEESKRTAAAERERQAEDNDLAKALRLSEEEEAKRNKAVEDSNASSLFDEQNQLYVIHLLAR
jgi:epsin